MKTNFYIAALSLLTLCLFASCEDDGDTVKPVIDLREPGEGARLPIGDEHGVHFEMDLSDNEALASYTIEVHNNFDHHDHDTKAVAETQAFYFKKIYTDCAGLKEHHVHNHDIVIPATATPGDYHLMVWCADAEGNENRVARNIVLGTATAPDKR